MQYKALLVLIGTLGLFVLPAAADSEDSLLSPGEPLPFEYVTEANSASKQDTYYRLLVESVWSTDVFFLREQARLGRLLVTLEERRESAEAREEIEDINQEIATAHDDLHHVDEDRAFLIPIVEGIDGLYSACISDDREALAVNRDQVVSEAEELSRKAQASDHHGVKYMIPIFNNLQMDALRLHEACVTQGASTVEGSADENGVSRGKELNIRLTALVIGTIIVVGAILFIGNQKLYGKGRSKEKVD